MRNNAVLLILSLLLCGQGLSQSLACHFQYHNAEVLHDALVSFGPEGVEVWVKYYEIGADEVVVVHQRGLAVLTAPGVTVLCDAPMYANTCVHADYQPDRFYLEWDDEGNVNILFRNAEGCFESVKNLDVFYASPEYTQVFRS